MIGYVLNSCLEVIEVINSESERYRILSLFIRDNIDLLKQDLIGVNITSDEVEILINSMLLERGNSPTDAPTFGGRFYEHEIFQDINFKESSLKLCNTGFDNGIIFLINLFNACKSTHCFFYLLFGRNHSEVKTLLKQIKLKPPYSCGCA